MQIRWKQFKMVLLWFLIDRKDQGLVLLLSILNNIEMSSLKTLSHAGFMNASAENECVNKYAEQLHIKMANKRLPASSLSGGNQQKVVIAKCLATNRKF